MRVRGLTRAVLLAVLLVTGAIRGSSTPPSDAVSPSANQYEVHKTSTSRVSISPTGEVLSHSLDVTLTLRNPGYLGEASITDRVVMPDLDTLRVNGVQPTAVTETLRGLVYLTWSGVRVEPGKDVRISYSVETALPPPVRVAAAFRVNGTEAEPLSSGGRSYLPVRRGDSVEISLSLRNDLCGCVDGDRVCVPLSSLLLIQVDGEILEDARLTPSEAGTFNLGGTTVHLVPLRLGDGEATATLAARVSPDADVGLVRLRPITVSVTPAAQGNLSELLERREDLVELRESLIELNASLASYDNLLRSMGDTLANLSGLLDSLGYLSNSSADFARAMSALRALTEKLEVEVSYMVQGLTALERALRMEFYLLTNSTQGPPPQISDLLDGLQELGHTMQGTVDLLNDTVSAISNGTGRGMARMGRIANDTATSLVELNSSLRKVEGSGLLVRRLAEGLTGQVLDVGGQIDRLDDLISISRVRSLLYLPASADAQRVRLRTLSADGDGTWKAIHTDPQGDPYSQSGEPVVLAITHSSGAPVTIDAGCPSPSVISASSPGGVVTTLVAVPLGARVDDAVSASGVGVRAAKTPASDVAVWVDLAVPGGTEASYSVDLSAAMPRLAIEFLPGGPPSARPASENITEPLEGGFELRPWMWFPILGAPLLAVVLLVLLEGAPAEEAGMNQEARRLLERLDVLAKAAPREGERREVREE